MRRAAVVAMLALSSAIMAGLLYAQGPSLELWITTSVEAGVVAGLGVQPRLAFGPDNDEAMAAINVGDSKVYQRMEGGGEAFTEGTAWLIRGLHD
jgi:hypothetical protein